MARPITDTLRLLDEGAFLDRCSDLLATLVRGVEETGRPGKLQITLDVKRGAKGAMLIRPDVATKVPEAKCEATMLWATPEGNLTADNPKQHDDNAETIAAMKVFERFAIGVPVFRGGAAYRVDARLKYRHQSSKVAFWYELIRPDRVHEAVAKELIEKVRTSVGSVPVLMGDGEGCARLGHGGDTNPS